MFVANKLQKKKNFNKGVFIKKLLKFLNNKKKKSKLLLLLLKQKKNDRNTTK